MCKFKFGINRIYTRDKRRKAMSKRPVRASCWALLDTVASEASKPLQKLCPSYQLPEALDTKKHDVSTSVHPPSGHTNSSIRLLGRPRHSANWLRRETGRKETLLFEWKFESERIVFSKAPHVTVNNFLNLTSRKYSTNNNRAERTLN